MLTDLTSFDARQLFRECVKLHAEALDRRYGDSGRRDIKMQGPGFVVSAYILAYEVPMSAFSPTKTTSEVRKMAIEFAEWTMFVRNAPDWLKALSEQK